MQTKDSAFRGKVLSPVEIDRKQITETGEFEGYASIFGLRDQGDDIVMPGAFAESLAGRPADRVKMLWQHRTDTPIGKWLEMREDGRGLYVKGRLFLSVNAGKEAYELMREGAVDGLSIGYRTIQDNWDRDSDARQLIKVDLRECSVVTFPMLEAATVTLVKGDKLPTEREFEQWLQRDAGFTRSQSKAIIAQGYKALTGQRDAVTGDDRGVRDALNQLTQLLRG